MVRGQILIKILELLHDQAMNQVDFFGAVLASGYGASASKIDYEYQKRQGLTVMCTHIWRFLLQWRNEHTHD